VRTILTLDDDVAAKLEAECRRQGKQLGDVVNELLRRGLGQQPDPAGQRAFAIEPRDLGDLRPGLSLDSVADLIEQVEDSLHR